MCQTHLHGLSLYGTGYSSYLPLWEPSDDNLLQGICVFYNLFSKKRDDFLAPSWQTINLPTSINIYQQHPTLNVHPLSQGGWHSSPLQEERYKGWHWESDDDIPQLTSPECLWIVGGSPINLEEPRKLGTERPNPRIQPRSYCCTAFHRHSDDHHVIR